MTVGIIGGTGLAALGERPTHATDSTDTPFGPASDMPRRFAGVPTAVFLNRHGEGHTVLPHQINYRANLWLLNELGVDAIVAVFAVGGIARSLDDGDFVLPDQLVDYTWGREHTFAGSGASPSRSPAEGPFLRGASPSRSPAEGPFLRGASPSRSPAEGPFLRGASPSRSPAEGPFLRGASPSRSPAEGSFLRAASPSRSPAEGSHVDFSEPFDAGLRRTLAESAGRIGLDLCDGVYGCTQGPRFETAAEIDRMDRDGCTVVGMTAMPEAALARELGLPYAGVCLVVNPAAGRGLVSLELADMLNIVASAQPTMRRLLLEFLQLVEQPG